MIDQVLQREICTWLTANGINPRDVPMDERPVALKGAIVLFVYDFPKVLDPTTYRPRGRVVEFPLIVSPTCRVTDWLDGKRRLNGQ